MSWLLRSVIAISVLIAALGALFAALTLAERKLLGRVQNRPGPNRTGPWGLLQPLADGIKMLTKEDVVPEGADGALHLIAPIAVVAFSLLPFAVIPFARGLALTRLDCGLLYFFAAGAATELAVFTAGWSSHNKYSLLGAMRALAQLISYELPLVLSWVPVAMVSGTLSATGVVAAQGGWKAGFLPRWNLFTPWGLAGFAIFMVAALAESNRAPFDLPEAESELTAGHLTEYSGFKYALFFMAEYFGMIGLSAMAVTLFLGGWRAPLPFLGGVPSLVWFALKLLALLLLFMWVRATLPRLRMDQLMALAWKWLLPVALANLAAAGIWSGAANGPAAWQVLRWASSAACVVLPAWGIARAYRSRYAPRTYRYAA